MSLIMDIWYLKTTGIFVMGRSVKPEICQFSITCSRGSECTFTCTSTRRSPNADTHRQPAQ